MLSDPGTHDLADMPGRILFPLLLYLEKGMTDGYSTSALQRVF
jgi:hypothetical protein